MRTCLVAIVLLFLTFLPAMGGVIQDKPLPISAGVSSSASVRSPIIYDNTSGQLFAGTTSGFTHDCDDGSFAPQSTNGYVVDAVNIGFVARSGASQGFDLLFQFYNTMVGGANPVTTGSIANSRTLVHVGGLAPGNYQTGFVDVTPFVLPAGIGGAGTPFGNWGIEVDILVANGTGHIGIATTLFAGGPQGIGSSADVCWHDTNGDNLCSDAGGEQRNFGGGARQAN